MDRDIPIFNRPIMDKIHRKNQQLHLKRLQSIKAGSNRTMPLYHPPQRSISNKKAMLKQEMKKTEIEKQNILLFNKMVRIMKRSDPHNQPKNLQQRNTRTSADQSRITQENRCILERLESQKPTISTKKLQEERNKKLSILKFLGKYPNPNANKTFHESMNGNEHSRMAEIHKKDQAYYRRGAEMGDEQQFEEEYCEDEINPYHNQMKMANNRIGVFSSDGRRKYMSQAMNTGNKLNSEESDEAQRLDYVHINPNPQFEDSRAKIQKSKPSLPQKNFTQNPQIILYQCTQEIEGKNACIQFFRNYNSYTIKATFEEPVENKLIHTLEIPEEEGNQFFSSQNYDYPTIAKMVIMEDEGLVIHPQMAATAESYEKKENRNSNQFHLQEKTTQKMAMPQETPGIGAKYQEALDEFIE